MQIRRFRYVLSAIFMTSLLGCAENGIILGGEDDWEVVDPSTVGLSQSALDASASQIGNILGRGCLTVIKDGKLAFERYYSGNQFSRYNGFSAVKSFSATLIGVAEQQGYLSVDDRMADWLPDQPELPHHPDATIKHVLSQVSESNPPGTDFNYDNGPLMESLADLISVSTNRNPVEFAYNELFSRIGIRHSSWGEDFNSDLPTGGGGGWTCRDMARLGQLYLNGGMWNGERIVSEQFINDATVAQYPEANGGYGYLWWLNHDVELWRRVATRGTGKMMPSVPSTAFFASGAFGQIILVDPAQDLVITSAGLTFEVETLNTVVAIWDALAPALTE